MNSQKFLEIEVDTNDVLEAAEQMIYTIKPGLVGTFITLILTI